MSLHPDTEHAHSSEEKPAKLHQRITSSPEDDEYDPLLEGLGDGCAKVYAQLEVDVYRNLAGSGLVCTAPELRCHQGCYVSSQL